MDALQQTALNGGVAAIGEVSQHQALEPAGLKAVADLGRQQRRHRLGREIGGSLLQPLAVDAPQPLPIDRRHIGCGQEGPDITGGDQQIELETEVGGGITGQGGAQLIPAERTLSKGGQQAPAVVALEEHLAAHGESRPAGP